MHGHRHKRRSWSFTALSMMVLWIFSSALPSALAMAEEDVEYPAKLAFLYNFAKFVEWPAASNRSPNTNILICIAGRDPFSPRTESQLRTRIVLGHPIEIRTMRVTDSFSACNIVFVPITEQDQAANILRGLRGSSTLTVGEIEGFAARGGIINLMIEGNRLRFEINPLAAGRAGLKISSKLLSLAKIVMDDQLRSQ
jgi:hypothetical protein